MANCCRRSGKEALRRASNSDPQDADYVHIILAAGSDNTFELPADHRESDRMDHQDDQENEEGGYRYVGRGRCAREEAETGHLKDPLSIGGLVIYGSNIPRKIREQLVYLRGLGLYNEQRHAAPEELKVSRSQVYKPCL